MCGFTPTVGSNPTATAIWDRPPAGDVLVSPRDGYRRFMSRIASVLRTIAAAIATVVRAIAHAIVVVVTLPFRALAKLFGGRREPR